MKMETARRWWRHPSGLGDIQVIARRSGYHVVCQLFSSPVKPSCMTERRTNHDTENLYLIVHGV